VPLTPRSDGRIRIAPEVLHTVGPHSLSRLYDQREHTEMVCFLCGGVIAPEDATEAQVVVFKAPDKETILVKISHPRCMPSCVLERPLPALAQEWSLDWVAVLRSHAISAVLVWEMHSTLHHGNSPADMEDVFAERLRGEGFRGATDRLDDLVAPVLRRWSIRLRDDCLVLHHPSGDVDEFAGARAVVPPGWLDAARDSTRVLAVYGSGFGLDRLLRSRLDQVLQAGDAVCGLIPWSSGSPSASSHR